MMEESSTCVEETYIIIDFMYYSVRERERGINRFEKHASLEESIGKSDQ